MTWEASISVREAPCGSVEWSALAMRDGHGTHGKGRRGLLADAIAAGKAVIYEALGIATRAPAARIVVTGSPGRASANRARRVAVVNGQASTYQSADSKGWRKDAASVIRSAYTGPAIDRPCEVRILSVYDRWSRKHGVPYGDADNAAKQVLDALARGGVIVDDILVTCVVASKAYDRHNPRIEVEVHVL